MSFTQQLARVSEIRSAETPGVFLKQRIAENAHTLSRAGEMAARVECINEALTAFAALLYQADSDGDFANVDPITHRILVPAPFGSSGWRKWGLRSWEAGELRRFLAHRCQMRDKRPALFDYNSESRTWHLNAHDYSSFDAASHYLKREPMTVKSLRAMSGQYKKTRVQVASSRNQGVIKV